MSADLSCADDDGPWATTWLELHNPSNGALCLPVVVTEGFFQHVVIRHGDEPVDDLFGHDLADLFRRCFQPDFPRLRRHDCLAECAPLLERETRLTLDEGLVLTYRVAPADRAPFTTWIALLGCGALIILRDCPDVLSLRTLFFPRAGLGRHSPQARFSAVVSRLVSRYALMNVGQNAIVPPPANYSVEVRGEVRHDIRFHRLEAWGFRPELAGCPYRGRHAIPVPAPESVELRARFRPATRYRWRRS